MGPLRADLLLVLKAAYPAQDKEEGGSARASPVATPMPKSVSS